MIFERKLPPVIIVGMARSGTTLVTELLSSKGNFHVEVEPHALWKSGNFIFLNDEEFSLKKRVIQQINRKFSVGTKGLRLLEKSPINSLRPELVHKVFPDAFIIYIERDPVRCIYSNYVRSKKNDSFKPSITLKKYFLRTGSEDLPNAISTRNIFRQISLYDIPYLVRYIFWMVFWRNFSKTPFPFGPKLKGFREIVKEKGLLGYHIEVYKRSQVLKLDFKQLFGARMIEVKLEDIMTDKKTLEEIYRWVGLDISSKEIENTFDSIDKERRALAVEQKELDDQIHELLKRN